MRMIVLLDVCLALAAGPMYTKHLQYKLCSLVCEQTPTVYWRIVSSRRDSVK
jgi:hypothetical protein